MKAILEFSLPEESNEFKVASNADEYRELLWEIDEKLRLWQKNKCPFENVEDVIDELRNFIYEETIERCIPLEI
ncbi:MAG: hypothetical protein ACUVWN_12770 [bacterium]